jgi:hypothetical protein
MITELPARLAALPPRPRAISERLLAVSLTHGTTEPPPEMEPWIAAQFGSVAAVRHQTVVRVVNRLTLEGAAFNPLRARRPSDATGGDEALEERIAAELAGPDFFREPLLGTTADVFGRIRGRYCVTASNVAKFEGWHGLVIFDEPHPLHFSRAQLRDYFEVAARWLAAAHAHAPRAAYPLIGWNCLPKSGATIMHGHMHLTLAEGIHYARIEAWRRAAEEYRARYGANYFDDLYTLHAALGLALPAPAGVRAFVSITPLRNREVVLFDAGAAGAATDLPPPLARLLPLAEPLYDILHGLIDGQGMRAFNVAAGFPPLAPTPEDWRGVPLTVRLADRGHPLTTRNDWGVMELFATGCVTADPFDVAARLGGNHARNATADRAT